MFSSGDDYIDRLYAMCKKEKVRVSIEPASMGLYKSIAYEIFKRRCSVLLMLDGNSAGINLMQEAKNAKHETWTVVNPRARMLAGKAKSLEGYVTLFEDGEDGAAIVLVQTEKYARGERSLDHV